MTKKGVVLWHQETIDARDIPLFAEWCEDSGVDSLWFPETWVRDGSIHIAMAAQAVDKIKLGSAVFNIYGRSPGLMAQTAAELDVLSNGRFHLGLGSSGQAVIENWHGVPFGSPLKRSREMVDALRQAFRGDRVELSGEIYRMSGFKLRRRPVQERLPIYLGSNGPNYTRLTGEIADGWIPFCIPFSRMKDALKFLEEGAESAGRAVSEIDVAPFVYAAPFDDLERARALVKPELGFYIGAMGDYYHAQLTRWGYGEDADNIRAAWRKGGRRAAGEALSDALLDDLAICGPKSRCNEMLAALRETGVTQPLFRVPDETPEEDVKRALRTLGELD